MNSVIESAKQLAATRAVNEWIGRVPRQTAVKAIGIGSGSTVVHVVERLAELAGQPPVYVALEHTVFVPTSFQARQLISQHQLHLGELNSYPKLDIAFDGADEVNEDLACIKGGGGAHLQEKLVASCAEELIVVADYRKESVHLGQKWKKGVPLEVSPLAYVPVMQKLSAMGGQPLLRMAKAKAGPVVTDNGNFIVDVDFGEIPDAAALDVKLQSIVGILETGLFVGLCKYAYFGQQDGTVSRRVAKH